MCRCGGGLYYYYHPRYNPGKQPALQREQQQNRKECPLRGVRVELQISNFTAQVQLQQRFVNNEENPIEAVYEFLTDDRSAVCSFAAQVDGRMLQGQLMEKTRAKDEYDDAIASGGGAYLLKEDKTNKNLFRANVGNLPPGKECTLFVTYVTELDLTEDGQLKFKLPTKQATQKADPKPSSTANSNQPSWLQHSIFRRRTMDHGGHSTATTFTLGDFELSATIEMTEEIESIACPNYPKLETRFDKQNERQTKATLSLEADASRPDKDFEVLIALKKPLGLSAKVAVDEKGHRAAVVAFDPVVSFEEDEEVYNELIFLVDRSGSMRGNSIRPSRIRAVADTIQIFLRSMSEGSLFNIICFGDHFQMLFPSSQEYSQETMRRASEWADSWGADMGGTNILSPLLHVLEQPTKEGYPRQLFLLTDGEVTNTNDCINAVREHADTTRVFTFGIGEDASRDLVQGMADAGNGFAEFMDLKTTEEMDDKVLRQLDRAMKPALTNLRVDWGSIASSYAPFTFPPLFVGGRLLAYAFLQEDQQQSESEATITLHAETALGPFSTSVQLDLSQVEQGNRIHRLAARALIRDLQDGKSFMHDTKQNGSSKATQEVINERCKEVSLRYGVISRFTAFVVTEEREEATEGTMELRPIRGTIAGENRYDQDIYQPKTYGGMQLFRKTSVGRGGARRKNGGRKDGANYPVPQSLASSVSRSSSITPNVVSSDSDDEYEEECDEQLDLLVESLAEAEGKCKEKEERARSTGKKDKNKKKSKKLSSINQEEQRQLFGMAPPPPPAAAGPPSRRMSGAPLGPGGALPPPRPSSSTSVAAPTSSSFRSSASAEVSSNDPLRQFIIMQNAAGLWALSDIAAALKKSENVLRDALPPLPTSVALSAEEYEQLWATAVAIAYLAKTYKAQQIKWSMPVKKARRAIKKAGLDCALLEEAAAKLC
ncbi:von Willebrand factor A domain containing 5B1 [Balamuthia mandrillaris]